MLWRRWMLVWLIAGVVVAGGCASTTGAPRKPYKGNYTKSLTADASLGRLLNEPLTDETRKQHVFTALAAIDVRYNEFKQELAANRNHTAALAESLTLMMTIAGSLTGSAGVKENYLQGIALVTGGASIYDKNYLQSQTVAALLAQMDANREAKLLEIVTSLGEPLAVYPGPAAYNDILEYYQAGTVLGAVMGIQKDAKESEGKDRDARKRATLKMR